MRSQLHFNLNYCLSSHFHQRLLCGFCTWTKFFARKDLQIGKALHPSPNKDISPTIPNKKSWRALSLWTKPTKQFETGCQRNSFHISAIFRSQSSPKSVWQSSTNYECVVSKIRWKGFEKRRLSPRRRFCSRSWNLSQGDVECHQTCTWARLRDTTLLFAISFWFSIES